MSCSVSCCGFLYCTVLSLIFSLSQPPGFRRAYSSPLYSSQQNATIKELLPFCTWFTFSSLKQSSLLT